MPTCGPTSSRRRQRTNRAEGQTGPPHSTETGTLSAGSRVGFFAASMYSEESMIGTATRTFSADPTFAPTGVGADRLDGEAVSKHGVVPDLLQLVSRRA